MAKALARTIGYRYIDSGAMYRAVALYAMRNGMISPDGIVDEEKLIASLPNIKINFNVDGEKQHTMLNGEDVENEIRQLAVSNNVSQVATIPAVRHALVDMQQKFGNEKGIVMDGRDIGTTVFPNAEMKVFVTASAEVRAQRRYDELTARGDKADFNEILENVLQRDHLDQTREVSPLKKADDALLLDNSNLTREEQMDWLIDVFNKLTEEC